PHLSGRAQGSGSDAVARAPGAGTRWPGEQGQDGCVKAGKGVSRDSRCLGRGPDGPGFPACLLLGDGVADIAGVVAEAYPDRLSAEKGVANPDGDGARLQPVADRGPGPAWG